MKKRNLFAETAEGFVALAKARAGTSPAMTRRYLRDKEIPVVEGPGFRRVQKDAA